LFGHGNVLVARPRSATTAAGREPPASSLAAPSAPASPERRAILEAGLLAAIAVVVASLALPLRLLGAHGGPTSDGTAAGGPPATPGGSEPGASGGPSPSAGPMTGAVIARVADVTRRGFAAFTVPFDSPPPLPAGDPAVVVRLADGTFVAFDATCTHAGCTVEWDAADGVLLCPCHDAAFDPARGAAVLAGPTNQPLTSLPIVVDEAAGSIRLRG
ncbi:MAG TPA: Rieske 2Fe-2S domain-containing protein, partial [Candidatus Limnocylindrales bacterium]